jgi:hypothetical protein
MHTTRTLGLTLLAILTAACSDPIGPSLDREATAPPSALIAEQREIIFGVDASAKCAAVVRRAGSGAAHVSEALCAPPRPPAPATPVRPAAPRAPQARCAPTRLGNPCVLPRT